MYAIDISSLISSLYIVEKGDTRKNKNIFMANYICAL